MRLERGKPLPGGVSYCNPLPLPDYPRGYACRENHPRSCAGLPDFRETADPTVLYDEGKWYLYSSCGMAYVSEDFATWTHVHLQPEDIGYAPTVVKHAGRYLLTASGNPELWAADNPLGPFACIGKFHNLRGEIMVMLDPMLFSDDDGRLYAYWGGGSPIYGVELDPADPCCFLGEPTELFRYDPAHVWERVGEWNEDSTHSFVEGSWMFKHGENYYLTYCAPGTEFSTYAMGAYRGKGPLGPFRYQENNPILSKKYGIVRGPGHGSIVEGPGKTLWAFYTCTLCHYHNAERRIGMDPLGIDERGNLYVKEATEIPQWAPGLTAAPEEGNGCGLLPVTFRRGTSASSSAPGRDPLYATDDSMLTWWQPDQEDNHPWLQVHTGTAFELYAVRIIWREVGLDYDAGVTPGPMRYRIAARGESGEWITVLDASQNQTELTIDYRPLERVVRANQIRLDILETPAGIQPGVLNFTVFGLCPTGEDGYADCL